MTLSPIAEYIRPGVTRSPVHRVRLMYIEDKSGGLVGRGRIGRVLFSRSGWTLTYAGRSFLRVGSGYKHDHVDVGTGDEFWISGPRRDGADGLYGRITQADDVDADVAEEYWLDIRSGGPSR